jgi:hypothetical protein
VPDRSLPEAVDPESARAALLAHMNNALEGHQYEYDNDRTIYVWMTGIRPDGTEDKYLVRLMFLYYPEWPPNVTFVNLDTRRYDGTHWPKISGATRLAFTPVYPDAPAGLVCNSMTFEYYFWGGHSPAESIKWNKTIHTFAATIAELQDHLGQPFYQGRAE